MKAQIELLGTLWQLVVEPYLSDPGDVLVQDEVAYDAAPSSGS